LSRAPSRDAIAERAFFSSAKQPAPGVDQVLEFVATKPGTYEFKCAKVCGMHHGKMKGELIVEE